MAGRNIFKGCTSSVFAADNTRTWNRLFLSNATASRDTNSIASSFSENGLGTTITVDGGTACDLPTDGATWFFELKDRDGNQVDANDFFDAKLLIDVITPAADETDLYLTAGIFTSTTAASGLYGGLVYDLASGPNIRAGNSAANTDTGASSTNKKVVAELTLIGGFMRNINASSYDGSDAYQNNASRGGVIGAGTAPLYVGISLGRKTNIAGAATITFRAYQLGFYKGEDLP